MKRLLFYDTTILSASLIFLLIIMSLTSCYKNIKTDLSNYDKVLVENENLVEKIKVLEDTIIQKDNNMEIFKDNAAYILALEPVSEYFAEEELYELIKEIPKGNPFVTDYLVTASFGESTGFFPREKHYGQDMIPLYPENMDWEIYATASGEVISDGEDVVHGKNILIQNTPRIRTRFSHMSKYFYEAVSGRKVTTDTLIGIMGNTGYSTNAHLHYEIWIKVAENKWIKIDPKPFVDRRGRNVYRR